MARNLFADAGIAQVVVDLATEFRPEPTEVDVLPQPENKALGLTPRRDKSGEAVEIENKEAAFTDDGDDGLLSTPDILADEA